MTAPALGKRVRCASPPTFTLGKRVRKDDRRPEQVPAVARFVNDAEGGWSSFRTRYIKSEGGVAYVKRIYGIDTYIGAPWPESKGKGKRRGSTGGDTGGTVPTARPAPASSSGGVKLTPAQRDAAERHLGREAGAGRGAYLDGNRLVVEDRDAAVAALDNVLANADLTPGERKARKNLRDKIAASDATTQPPAPPVTPAPDPTPDPTPAPEPDPATTAGGLDEARVQATARAVEAAAQAAIDDHLAGFLGGSDELARIPAQERAYLAANALSGSAGPEVQAAVRAELARQYPDATDIDLDDAVHSAMAGVNRSVDTPRPGDPPPGRGTDLGVRALERQQAVSGRPIVDVVADARAAVGDPNQFGRDTNDSDGGPGERSLEQLNAVRDAGAALTAEMNRRIAALRAGRPDDPMAAHAAAAAAHRASVEQLRRDIDNDWQATFGERLSPQRMDAFLDNPSAELIGGEGMPLTAEQAAARNAVRARYRDRANAAFDEETRVMQLQRQGQTANRDNVLAEIAVRRQVLEEARTMGRTRTSEIPVNWTQGTDRARLAPMVDNAQDHFPSDWLSTNAAARPEGLTISFDGERGYFLSTTHTINPGEKADDGTQQATMTHEMMHSMEYTVPGLSDAEAVFLRDRTSSGPVGSRTFDEQSTIFGDEVGYRDDFREHYTGRVYGLGRAVTVPIVGERRGYEVLTTGAESLFTPTRGFSFTDADMEHFVLGAMAVL